MPILRDCSGIFAPREARDKKGKTYYWCYTKEYFSETCLGCVCGTCVQKAKWYLDGEGIPDGTTLDVKHDCEKELS